MHNFQEFSSKSLIMYFFPALLALYLTSQTLACGSGIHVRAANDAPQYAPIPAEAAGIPLVNGYGVEDYGNGAYMVTEGSYQGL